MSTYSYFEPLRRFYRNWLRKKKRVLPTDLPTPFFYAQDINAVHEYFDALASENGRTPDSSSEFNGTCHICKKEVVFKVDLPADGDTVNWRETLKCPECGLINRWRSCLHVFDAVCQPVVKDRIYLTESLTPVHQNLASRFPALCASEYFPDCKPGELIDIHGNVVRNEDVTRLTFADASMESILCFDLLEYVRDYRSALREFYRVLNSGGQLLISVTFRFQQESLLRATLDQEGNVKHLVEPSFHGDPQSAQAMLRYHDFGMELLDEIRQAGFQECFLLCYNSIRWGYPNDNVILVARKLKSSVRKTELIKSAWQRTCYQSRLIQQAMIMRFRSIVLSTRKRVTLLFKPHSSQYRDKVEFEKDFFKEKEEIHDLPDIFHYWSNKYLAAEMRRFGFDNSEEFFIDRIQEFLKASKPRKVELLSIGSGNCDLELRIGKELLRWGHDNFVFECLDLNPDMLERGREAAGRAGLAAYFRFSRDDFNNWKPVRKYGVILANQSLHHVLNLEGLFDSVKKALQLDGVFLVSDMIGRNGHMRWPEALDALKPFWNELPENYRFNRLQNRLEPDYINHDCSTEGFEGIRAQDILPLLLERFNFNFFFPFGNIIFVFIDRPFGHNFDAAAEWDKDFIDRVHERDEAGLISAELKPTSMLAVLSCGESETQLRHPMLSPQHCVRLATNND